METPFLYDSQLMESTYLLAKAKIAVRLGVGMVSYLVPFLVQTHSGEDFQNLWLSFHWKSVFMFPSHLKISFPCEKFLFSTAMCVHREKRIRSHHGRYHSLHSSSCPPLQFVHHNPPHPSLFGPSREFRPRSGFCRAVQGQASVLGVRAGLALLTTGGCLNPETQQLHKVHSEILNDLKGLARIEKKSDPACSLG